MKSGFVSLVGRPNVGKSTLLNQILGTKVSIVSNKVQTTRGRVRGILNRDGVQAVFVDTPGISKPRTLLGERLNDTAYDEGLEADVVLFVIDASQPFGAGDEFVGARVPKSAIAVVNKIDRVDPERLLAQLGAVGALELDAYFPVSARTGEGVDALVDEIIERLPEGPAMFEEDVVSDMPEEQWVAELVREQLLAVLSEELPHSVATRVTEWEWPRVRVEILVERESQKGIVVGKGGSVLKEVGIRVRKQMAEGVYLELFVKVDKDWQRNPKSLDKLGY